MLKKYLSGRIVGVVRRRDPELAQQPAADPISDLSGLISSSMLSSASIAKNAATSSRALVRDNVCRFEKYVDRDDGEEDGKGEKEECRQDVA